MSLIRRIKQFFCKHDFHITKTYTDDGDEGLGYKPVEFAIIYCPKCSKQQTVTKIVFDVMKEIQRIDEEYARHKQQDNNRQP